MAWLCVKQNATAAAYEQVEVRWGQPQRCSLQLRDHPGRAEPAGPHAPGHASARR